MTYTKGQEQVVSGPVVVFEFICTGWVHNAKYVSQFQLLCTSCPMKSKPSLLTWKPPQKSPLDWSHPSPSLKLYLVYSISVRIWFFSLPCAAWRILLAGQPRWKGQGHLDDFARTWNVRLPWPDMGESVERRWLRECRCCAMLPWSSGVRLTQNDRFKEFQGYMLLSSVLSAASYIYIYTYVCVCVCVLFMVVRQSFLRKLKFLPAYADLLQFQIRSRPRRGGNQMTRLISLGLSLAICPRGIPRLDRRAVSCRQRMVAFRCFW
jgi:hypothetical protein